MKLFGPLFFIPLVHAICHHGTALHRRAESSPEFGFDGLTGPLNWHSLSEENRLCALGKNQSPINVNSSRIDPVPGSGLRFRVDNTPDGAAELENLGTTLEVAANGSLALGDVRYSLVQFHFHTPSEHRIDGEYYPMEAHFVFQSCDSPPKLAVVGVMIEIGDNASGSPLLTSVFANISDAREPGKVAAAGALDFGPLQTIVAGSPVFRYKGSLTTPPCSEDVAWNVVRQPIYVSQALFRKVKGVLKFNSRYTQNQPGEINLLGHAREVLEDEDDD